MRKYLIITQLAFVVLVTSLATVLFGGSIGLERVVDFSVYSREFIQKFGYLKDKYLDIQIADSKETSDKLAKSLLVVYYHGVTENQEDTQIDYDNFVNQLFMLKRMGYQSVTLQQAHEFLQNGVSLPDKSFLLTFDDGRKDSYYPVDHVLEKLGFNAVMFVITSQMDSKDAYYLTERELKQMIASGRWEVQSHGRLGHEKVEVNEEDEEGAWYANKLWLEEEGRLETLEEYRKRVNDDLAGAKYDLESKLGIKVNSLAVPFGNYGQRHTNFPEAEDELRKMILQHYDMFFIQPETLYGKRNYPFVDKYNVKRIEPERIRDLQEFVELVEQTDDKPMDYVDDFSSNRGWVNVWGVSQVENSRLTLTGDFQSSGVYLNGSELWEDYVASMRVVLGAGVDSFSVMTRINRQRDYAYCAFSPTGVSFHERIGDTIYDGAAYYGDFTGFFRPDAQVGVRVEGDIVSCTLNGVPMVIERMRHVQDESGMAGLTVFGQTGYNVSAVVTDYIVKPLRHEVN